MVESLLLLIDLPHKYSIKSSYLVSFVILNVFAYWEPFGPFLIPSPFSFCYNVCTLPKWVGSLTLQCFLTVSSWGNLWVSQPGAENWCTMPHVISTTSGYSIHNPRIIPKLVSLPEAKRFRLWDMTRKKVPHLMGLTKSVCDWEELLTPLKAEGLCRETLK